MEKPHVAIQICTYNRYSEIKKVVAALQRNLIYPKDLIHLYICDDSSPGDYVKRLSRLKAFSYWETTFISTVENSGWGINVNNGLSRINEDFIFFIEDDYVLTRTLDLRVGIALMQAKPHIGMLRYRGSAGGRFVMHQFEADISESPLFTFAWYEAVPTVPFRVTYQLFDGRSQELYVYSNGPHLKTKEFHKVYGLYDEGKKLGETEESFAHRVKQFMQTNPADALTVGILPEWIPMQFDHIGKSFQHTEEDN